MGHNILRLIEPKVNYPIQISGHHHELRGLLLVDRGRRNSSALLARISQRTQVHELHLGAGSWPGCRQSLRAVRCDVPPRHCPQLLALQ